MKVKATTNFAGEICMARGDVRDVPESVAAPLLECGYLEALEPVQTSEQKDEQDSETEATQESETEATQESETETTQETGNGDEENQAGQGQNGGLMYETL